MKTPLTLAAILAATTFAFTSATTLTVPEKSQAAGCSYRTCLYENPVTMGCDDGITVYGPKPITLHSGNTVSMEGRWSKKCQTNWLKFTHPSSWDSTTYSWANLSSARDDVGGTFSFGRFTPGISVSLMIPATKTDRVCATSEASSSVSGTTVSFPDFCV